MEANLWKVKISITNKQEEKNKHLKCVTFLVEVKLKHLFSCFKVFLKVCFWQGSNLRPSACEVDMITTTLQKPVTYDKLNTLNQGMLFTTEKLT